MKIAKILFGDPNNKKGVFNNFIERTKFLQTAEPNVDSFLIRFEYGFVLRLLKGNLKRQKKDEYSYVEGLKHKNIWVRLSLIDYLLTFRLNRKAMACKKQVKKHTSLFKEYDLLSPHGLQAIFLASEVKKIYDIPYVPTWHGSDINVWPFRNKYAFNLTGELIKLADFNFFVSKKLLDTSNKIIDSTNKDVLYTGPADIFVKYNQQRKKEIQKELKIHAKYTIGFIGNLVPIKNVLILPEIFKQLQINLGGISFVIVGNGALKKELTKEIEKQGIDNVKMLGKMEPNKVPDIINCLDVLVLPSLNEGLPMVTLEALSCSVPVVGSNRGGIAESIGDKNCFALDDSFVDKISNRIIEILRSNEKPQPLSHEFSWDRTVEKEVGLYKRII